MQSSKNVLVVPARIIESGNHLSKPKVCVDPVDVRERNRYLIILK
jgi:hypothetical protein